MITKANVTRFNVSKAFKINKEVSPKDMDKLIKEFFIKTFIVNNKAKYKGRKKRASWVKFAWIKLSGYGICKITNPKTAQKNIAGKTLEKSLSM